MVLHAHSLGHKDIALYPSYISNNLAIVKAIPLNYAAPKKLIVLI